MTAGRAALPSAERDRDCDRDAGHGLADGIVYGPVRSRRYGTTYGINILPRSIKRCDWNCVYCQLGYTKDPPESEAELFPAPNEIRDALLCADLVPGLDALVICGNGEPTLHPDFPAAMAALALARDASFPGVPLVCLTNASRATRKPIRRALLGLDEVSVKLDAGSCERLMRVNLPRDHACIETQIRLIKRLRAGIQSCFFDGPISNTAPADIASWIGAVARAMPSRVDLYTLSRSTPSGRLEPVSVERLDAIRERVRAVVDVPVRVFGSD